MNVKYQGLEKKKAEHQQPELLVTSPGARPCQELAYVELFCLLCSLTSTSVWMATW